MSIPFKKILKHVKNNMKQNTNIITTLPNEALLAAEDNKVNSKEVRISKLLNMSKDITEEVANKFVDEVDLNVKLGSISIDNVANVINKEWQKIKNVNPKIASKILKYETKGIGATEFLMSYLFDDVVISGGSESFDVKAGNKKYEIKSYNKTEDIRLGTEGTITRFPTYNLMFAIYDAINNLANLNTESEMNILINMLNTDKENNYKIEDIKNNALSKAPKSKGEPLFLLIRKGEISEANLKDLDRPLNYYAKLVSILHKTKFDYIKIINKNIIYPITSIDDSDIDNIIIKASSKNTKNEEKNVISAAHAVFVLMQKAKIIDNSGNLNENYSFTDVMVESIVETLNSDFEEHPMIVIDSSDSSKDNICLGVFKRFSIKRITQGKVKVNAIG